MSPLLFALFINDLVDFLPGGIKFSGIDIKVLLFADDLVIIADSPEKLQRMINRFYEYCCLWNLTVNLCKSKIMIFRGGGGPYASNEKWTFGNIRIEVVKKYKYLGFWITSNLNMNVHLEKKVNEAKAAIGSTWSKVFANPNIATEIKHKIFQSTALAILFYAAQCWGYKRYEEVESVLRFYLKRLYRLPTSTPNYMLFTEFGISDLYLTTFKLHLEYIVKVLRMNDSRIPKIIALYALRNRMLWFEEWTEIASSVGVMLEINLNDLKALKMQMTHVLNELYFKTIESAEWSAKSSAHREVYSSLNLNIRLTSRKYTDYPASIVSTVFQARGELLKLNFIPHRNDLPLICSLCNLNERENIIHFLGKCPILSEIRRVFFYKSFLNLEEISDILNGKDWFVLHEFVKEALEYRKKIVNEEF